MNYQQTLDFLFTRLPLFSRIGAAAYKADLDNTIQLCAALDNPEKKFKSIHIAGTNGKGSVSHMLAAVFQKAGYKTGLYTSPHLVDFRERIKINGEMISEQHVVTFTERVRPLIDAIEPSFFEITVGMAYDYFAEQKVDIAIIETGLGGRLDSTNVITPELSIITNIGFDHMNLLGNSLEQIAYEKAGIIKKDVPVIISETLPHTLAVFNRIADEKHSPLTIASQNWQVTEWTWEKHLFRVSVASKTNTDHLVYDLDLPGIYQSKNLLAVLEAIHAMRIKGWNIPESAVRVALKEVKKLTGLYGRWDMIHEHPSVILDVAHNVDGIKQLLQQVELTTHRELHLVIGMVKDKEIDAILSLLPITANYYFTQANIPRALPADELREAAATKKLDGASFPDVNTALRNAIDAAHQDDLIIVCGSVFLVGEVSRNINN
jgi:dihydrofolate synthase/folylpolyglutamate synthase